MHMTALISAARHFANRHELVMGELELSSTAAAMTGVIVSGPPSGRVGPCQTPSARDWRNDATRSDQQVRADARRPVGHHQHSRRLLSSSGSPPGAVQDDPWRQWYDGRHMSTSADVPRLPAWPAAAACSSSCSSPPLFPVLRPRIVRGDKRPRLNVLRRSGSRQT